MYNYKIKCLVSKVNAKIVQMNYVTKSLKNWMLCEIDIVSTFVAHFNVTVSTSGNFFGMLQKIIFVACIICFEDLNL